jgi:diacylglycerol kinase (ATP)
VLPLGTGNDLARTLNWGSGYTDESLSKILAKVAESRAVKLDRWKILTMPNLSVDLNTLEADDTSAIDKLKNDEMNNYFSIGADAHVVLEFHERREANPHKFSTRWYNFLQYGQYGSRDQIKKTWRNLSDFIQLDCDSKNYTDVIRSRGYHCIIFLNIPSYSSGTNPWGSHQSSSSSSSSSENGNFCVQSMSDGRIEVIGCFTSTLPKIVIGGAGERICQATHIKLTTSTYIPIQIDGEPAKLCPSIIEITLKNQAIMLEHVKYNTDSPTLGFHLNVQKSFEVKCVLMEDFELYRKDSNILATKAIDIGAICTANTTDSLLQIRNTINLLITNCANGFFTDKWSFLNGEEFYRISDDSDECLLDIVSSSEVIFILDENPKFTNKSYNSNLNLIKNNETSSNKAKVHLKKTSSDNDNNDDILEKSFQTQNINTSDEPVPVVVNSSNQIGAFPRQKQKISHCQFFEPSDN